MRINLVKLDSIPSDFVFKVVSQEIMIYESTHIIIRVDIVPDTSNPH